MEVVGWISANGDFDALRAMIKQLQQYWIECGIDQRGDFEIQVMDMTAQTPDDYHRLHDLGVIDALRSL